jgi:hypothetical protein
MFCLFTFNFFYPKIIGSLIYILVYLNSAVPNSGTIGVVECWSIGVVKKPLLQPHQSRLLFKTVLAQEAIPALQFSITPSLQLAFG